MKRRNSEAEKKRRKGKRKRMHNRKIKKRGTRKREFEGR